MSGSLVVAMDGKIAFARTFLKPNGLPTKFGWPNLLSSTNEDGIKKNLLTLPISKDWAVELRGEGHNNDIYDNQKLTIGPKAIVVQENGDLVECYMEYDKVVKLPIPNTTGSFFCRATSWPIESAATAASMCYRDPAKIYYEAWLANGYPAHAFLCMRVTDLGKAIKAQAEVAKEWDDFAAQFEHDPAKLADLPEELKEKRFQIAKRVDDMYRDFGKFAGATIHYSDPAPSSDQMKK